MKSSPFTVRSASSFIIQNLKEKNFTGTNRGNREALRRARDACNFERGTERSEIDRSERDVPRRGTAGRRDQRAIANLEKTEEVHSGMAGGNAGFLMQEQEQEC